MKTVVLKFGGASVATPEHFSRIAKIIISRKKQYDHVVTVVSAMGDTTNQLVALAKRVNPSPPRREYDMLVTVGERISIALLAMSLAFINQEAVSFTGSQSGIITTTDHSDARIIDVRPRRLLEALHLGKVVIVAGFQGVSTHGEITTLGRGGSDTTAVALGVALEAAHIEFYKDVPGIFSADPKENPQAELHPMLSYETAMGLLQNGSQVLHKRCVELAWKNQLPLFIRSFLNPDGGQGTQIGTHSADSVQTPVYESGVAPVT